MIQLVVAYDISDNDARARLAAYLSHNGTRLQRSVFLCEVKSSNMDQFFSECESRCDPDSDVLHMFPLCRGCSGDAHKLALRVIVG